MLVIFVASFVTMGELLLSVDLAKTFSDPFGSGEKRTKKFLAAETIFSLAMMILLAGPRSQNMVLEDIYWIGCRVVYLPTLIYCLIVIFRNFRHGGLSTQYRALILTRHGYFVMLTGFCQLFMLMDYLNRH